MQFNNNDDNNNNNNNNNNAYFSGGIISIWDYLSSRRNVNKRCFHFVPK